MRTKTIGLLLLSVLLLAACTAREETPAPTEPLTEEVTEPVTEPETEAETEEVTEAETEAAEPARMFAARYPLAVMVDNHPAALPQSGLQNADIIYEMVVEGGVSRLLVVTDEEEGEIGPIRSARPAFLNFVAENEAFYLHVGNYVFVQASPLADRIKDMDQYMHAGEAYYRVTRKAAPHNMYADIGQLYEAAESEGHALVPEEPLGYYREAEGNLPEGEPHYVIALTYDDHLHQRYEYDPGDRVYRKFVNEEPVVDERTGEPLAIGTYILLSVEHERMENGMHWAVSDVGEGEADLYHEGMRYPVTWEREAAGKPMVFALEGEEIVFPEGLLYIQLIPETVEPSSR